MHRGRDMAVDIHMGAGVDVEAWVEIRDMIN